MAENLFDQTRPPSEDADGNKAQLRYAEKPYVRKPFADHVVSPDELLRPAVDRSVFVSCSNAFRYAGSALRIVVARLNSADTGPRSRIFESILACSRMAGVIHIPIRFIIGRMIRPIPR